MKNMDKLCQFVNEKGPVCVGLDTDLSYLPKDFLKSERSAGENILAFNREIIDATGDIAACFKVQIAYYEALGIDGMTAYRDTLSYLRQNDLIAIGDIKRGDIAKTAELYARAHFDGEFEADIITLSSYMGLDSITPYLPYAESKGKGVFVLVRTSNPGAKDFEYKKLEDKRHIYDLIGDELYTLGKNYIGGSGYSAVGMVIGGTHKEEASEIRTRYENAFFLIPGYGAQGGQAEDIALYLKDGNGGVVNSSRAVLLAYQKEENNSDFAKAARDEVLRMREEIYDACKLTSR